MRLRAGRQWMAVSNCSLSYADVTCGLRYDIVFLEFLSASLPMSTQYLEREREREGHPPSSLIISDVLPWTSSILPIWLSNLTFCGLSFTIQRGRGSGSGHAIPACYKKMGDVTIHTNWPVIRLSRFHDGVVQVRSNSWLRPHNRSFWKKEQGPLIWRWTGTAMEASRDREQSLGETNWNGSSSFSIFKWKRG